jgi:hypothetical protein
MKYVSRDANLVQFYGACIHGDTIMLVMEFLEASPSPPTTVGAA